jgi:hypothetical protein
MSQTFDAVCDDFYVSSRLFLKLEHPLERETVLNFLDRIRKDFPSLTKLRRRHRDSLILEEDSAPGEPRRWVRLEPGSLRYGHFGAHDGSSAREMGEVILEHAPYYLTFSELDFDHLDLVYGFDLEYRGNHDQMVAETFYADHPLGGFALGPEAVQAIDQQPYLGIALSADCDLQAYIEVKSRTTTFEVRSGEFDKQPISVFLTVRKYWGVAESGTLAETQRMLLETADDLAVNRVIPIVVAPLAHAIASRS